MTDALFAMLGLDPERAAPVFLLVLARTLPLAWVAPWLGWKGTAASVRAAVAVALAVSLTPLAMAHAPPLASGWLPLALVLVREALVGAAFALAASMPLYALGWAGELVDRWRGSPAEAVVSGPLEGASPLGALHVAAGVVLFVLVGGHRVALAAFAGTFAAAPVGAGASAADLASFALGAGRLVTASLELAVAFAAPAAIAFVLLELALGVAGRAGPGLRLWFAGMPLRAGLGVGVALLGLAALLPRLSPLFAEGVEAAARLAAALGGSS